MSSTEQSLRVRRPDGPWRWLAIDLAALTAIVAVAVVVVFQLWRISLREPFTYGGDSLGIESSAKTMIQTGWVQSTSRLGAPFGQVLYDYPIGGDNGHYVLMRVMAFFTSDWVLLINGFYVASFFTAAWSAYLCQRWLGVGRIAAIVTSALYAFAPYHLARGISHLLLASYAVVPIGVLLAVRAATTPLSEGRASSKLALLRCHAPWVVLAVVAGSCGAYYAVFTLLTIVITGTLVALANRSWRPLGRAAITSAVVGGMFVVNLAGSILYRREHGANVAVAERTPIELDIYGLRIIQMVTPVPGHWIRQLADVSSDLSIGFPSENSQFFGLVGAAALLAMLASLLVAPVRARAAADDVRPLLVGLTFVFVVIGITGGLSWTFTIVGFTQIRAWNRLSIFIEFFALVWLGLTIGPRVRRIVTARPSRRPAMFGLAALVLVAGLADQGSMDGKPDPADWNASFRSDRDFFHAVEAALPAGSMVYELPYRRFPEEPAQRGSGDYDLLRPYLHTDTIAWSYGGMKGREADWQEQLVDVTTPELVEGLVAVGFRGIVIDRNGYDEAAASLEAELTTTTGRAPLVSPDGRWFFFDLSGLERRSTSEELADLRAELLEGPRLELGGCAGVEGEGEGRFQWCAASVDGSVLTAGTPEPSVLEAEVQAPAGSGVLHVTIDGVTTDVPVGPEVTAIRLELPAAPEVHIEIDAEVPAVVAAGDPRDLRFRLISPDVTPVTP